MRRRYIQVDGVLTEVSVDHAVPARNHDRLLWNDRLYQDDGDPRYNSRKQHAEYMKRNDLSLAGDYTDTWAKAAKERENIRKGHDTKRRVDIDRAIARRK